MYFLKIEGPNKEVRYQKKVQLVIDALKKPEGEKCIVIGNSQNEKGRAILASKVKASTIEPISCKRITQWGYALDSRGHKM